MSEETEDPKPTKLKLSIDPTPTEAPRPPAEPPTPLTGNESTKPAPPADYDPDDPFREIASQATPKKKAFSGSSADAPVKKRLPPELPSKPAPKIDDGSAEKLNDALEQLPKETEKKSGPLASLLIIGVLLLILGAAGYGIWYLLNSDSGTVEAATDQVVETTKPASTVGPITRAKETIAKVPVAEVPDPSQAAATETPTPVAATVEPETLEPKTVKPTAREDLKEQVAQFLSNAHIGAIKDGPRPRMQLNSQSYSVGDVIDSTTGLIFAGIKDKRLLFKDRNGIFYVKSF